MTIKEGTGERDEDDDDDDDYLPEQVAEDAAEEMLLLLLLLLRLFSWMEFDLVERCKWCGIEGCWRCPPALLKPASVAVELKIDFCSPCSRSCEKKEEEKESVYKNNKVDQSATTIQVAFHSKGNSPKIQWILEPEACFEDNLTSFRDEHSSGHFSDG